MARTYQCWDCGRTVSAEDVQRYDVSRTTFGAGRSPRIYMRKQRVNMCPECKRKHEKRDNIQGALILLAVAAAILYFVVLR